MITHNLFNLDGGDILNLTNGADSGFDLTIQNIGNSPVYLGGDDTVSADGFGYRLDAGTAFSIELSGVDDFWVAAGPDDANIAVLRAHLEVGK